MYVIGKDGRIISRNSYTLNCSATFDVLHVYLYLSNYKPYRAYATCMLLYSTVKESSIQLTLCNAVRKKTLEVGIQSSVN